jgi:hypothetical protein
MLQGLKLLPAYINPAHQIGSGPILLDYGGTVMLQQLINEASSQELIFYFEWIILRSSTC